MYIPVYVQCMLVCIQLPTSASSLRPLRSLDRRELCPSDQDNHGHVEIFFRYWPFSLESPSTFSWCFSLIIQSFYVLITSLNLSLFLELIEPKAPLFAHGC